MFKLCNTSSAFLIYSNTAATKQAVAWCHFGTAHLTLRFRSFVVRAGRLMNSEPEGPMGFCSKVILSFG